MKSFILATFGFLFLGFYEMSGGTDFEPGWWLDKAGAEEASVAQAGPQDDQVARADTGGMLTQVVARPAEASISEENAAEAEANAAAEAESETAQTNGRVDDLLLTRREVPAQETKVSTASSASVETSSAEADSGQESFRDIRSVDGNVVNMRSGPGTDFSVVAQLSRGDDVEVLRDTGTGWIKLRVIETDRIGWMADWLVTASAE
ncbi:SH3 domain-containing protein [Roseivivax sediminis]|uniref:SH3 domain-containing protein n=1 Tax=Roseivivax sediminis TaxID=936889 RepID=A0A1I2ASD3_9RHOB|nr:SH3 domain-containing protein [Roseivivax sediminis]SFE45790.1 SH3 domain-containing protein [Roseivivax sediminis]